MAEIRTVDSYVPLRTNYSEPWTVHPGLGQLLTTSGSTALDMAMLLCDLKPGDEEYEKLKRSIEEFGYARDAHRFDLSATTHARDAYYRHILELPDSSPTLCGLNFWAWSGLARPTAIRWQPFHDYCGDPAQEEQGLYSVFLSDTSTVNILRRALR